MFHFGADGGEFGLDGFDLFLDRLDVDLSFLFKGVYVAGDVEIVLVFPDLFDGGAVGVLGDGLIGLVGLEDLVEVLGAEKVLFFLFFELAGGVDEQDVGGVAFAFEDQDGSGDAGAVEKIGRETDDRVQEVFLD